MGEENQIVKQETEQKPELPEGGKMGKNGQYYSAERLQRLADGRKKSKEILNARGQSTIELKKAKQEKSLKKAEERIALAKKISDEVAEKRKKEEEAKALKEPTPEPKPEPVLKPKKEKPVKTAENLHEAMVWKKYYEDKYRQHKEKVKKKYAPEPEFDPVEHSRDQAKQKLNNYVNSEALKMAMNSIFN